MPTYDYVCTSCGHKIEIMHPIHGQGPSICGECGGPMRRAFGVPSFHFKGSGWARKERSGASKRNVAGQKETDSTSSEGAASTPSGSGSASGSGSGSGSGSASEPAPAVKDAD